ncbi:MAG TPA: ferredoxin--NADP reductase [Burkholderiales bacterium]|nr:ferredoxin--NADP reductase [Burkholderiales bacterium]
MTSADKYTAQTITEIRTWAPNLFSFKTTRDRAFRFAAGQFARLGVASGGEIVWRAYSIVSAPYDEHLEFYSIVVPGGAFTSQLASLAVGDAILVERRSYGFLTTERFECGRDLWMLSTGTGLAPFLSILYDLRTWESYENLVLVHGVRHRNELAYEEAIRRFKQDELFAGFDTRLIYLQAVTREAAPDALSARITALIDSGELERAAGLAIDGERSRIMICGNPDMVDDTRKLLAGRGLRVSRRGEPGHLAVENYW